MRKLSVIALLIIGFSACVPHKKITYFNDIKESEEGDIAFQQPPVLTLQPNDVVEIDINSVSKETNEYFIKSGSAVDKEYSGNTYQLSSKGSVILPLIGAVELKDKTLEEAEDIIKEAARKYLQSPTVNVRLVSFQVTLLGEVNNPGVYNISDSKATILEALGYAGDLSIYGKRDNILLIRNDKEEKKYFRFNLNSIDLLASKNFYLKNNDVIYVEPSKGKSSADDNAYRILPLVISTLTFVTVLISLSQ
jgi:polysaccharide export outer membrane protein